MDYWINREERKRKAERWDEKMRAGHKAEIDRCVRDSVIYSDLADIAEPDRDTETKFILVKADTVSALMHCDSDKTGRTAVLNFASYKNPGGYFLGGSSAQEESLCHESALYEILSDRKFSEAYYGWNRRNLNYALYRDRALYTPDVPFFRKDKKKTADVITCAAPNWKACSRYHPEKEKENEKTLNGRIGMLRQICRKHDIDTFITGAWGCGVFDQDPVMVCRMFIDSLTGSGLRYVIFAVPDQETYSKFRDNMP